MEQTEKGHLEAGSEDPSSIIRSHIEEIEALARQHDFVLLADVHDRHQSPTRAMDLQGRSVAGCDFSSKDYYDGWHGPNFSDCDCRMANFSNANLYMSHFTNADLRGADLRGANFHSATVDGIKVDDTTKGLESLGEASARFEMLRHIAEECGAAVPGLLLFFGGVPTEAQIREWKVDEETKRKLGINTDAYMKSVRRSEITKNIVISGDPKAQWYDAFNHTPADPWDSGFQPKISLDTPPKELLRTSSGYNIFWGQHEVHEDTPGGTLQESNSRHLSEIGGSVLDSYDQEHRTFLELGAGAGVAAGDASKKGATVDTVSLSPTSPDIRLNYSFEEIYRMIAKEFDHANSDWSHWQNILMLRGTDRMVMAGVRRLYYCTEDGPERLLKPEFPLKTRIAFALHTLFPHLDIFSKTPAAYIRKQYIGEMPGDLGLPENAYDVIHDDNGPLWHLSRISGEGKKAPSHDIAHLLYYLNALMKSDGSVVCKRIEANATNVGSLEKFGALMKRESGLEKYHAIQDEEFTMKWFLRQSRGGKDPADAECRWRFDAGDLFLMGTEECPPLVFAKKDSPIAVRMKKILNLRNNEGGFYRVENLAEKIVPE